MMIKPQVALLFEKLSDLPQEQRERYYDVHAIDGETRCEVEALLGFDRDRDNRIRDVLGEAACLLAVSNPSALPGTTCGPYRLLRLLGRGGMGSVYLAERSDGEVRQQVAIKFLHTGGDEPSRHARFLRERQILAGLNHSGIARLLDAGHTPDGQPYLVMEYVDGTAIDVYARRLQLRDRLRLFVSVCDAVAHAHRSLIVHRDLKPSNILIDSAGNPKLLDFGVAKLLEEEGQQSAVTLLTRDVGAPLTLQYAAPEQVTGGPVTTATDVYAMGVLLYVLLTGSHPLGTGTLPPAALVRAIVESAPPPMSESLEAAPGSSESPDKLRRSLRGDLDTIAAKALKKDPMARYGTVAALADDIVRHLQDEPIAARPDSLVYHTAKFIRRRRMAVALAGAAFLGVAGGVFSTIRQAQIARGQRDFAVRQLLRAEATNDLNEFLLRDAAERKAFTVKELLGRAEHIVERQRDGEDSSRIDLLVSIGTQYLMVDEYPKARRVLEEALRSSQALPDRSIAARAACALADVLARQGEMARAESLFQNGLSQLPSGTEFALDRMFCLLRGSSVARHSGATQEGIHRVQAAAQLLEQAPLRSQLLRLRVFMDLAEAYRVAGRNREAISAFEEASARLAALGRDDTETAGTLFNNWGVSLSGAGRPREAAEVLRRAIEISPAPLVMVNYAKALRDLARPAEAAQYAERGYAGAMEQHQHVVVQQALLVLARISRDSGDLRRAAEMLARVEPLLKQGLPAGHYAFGVLALEQALIHQAKGELERALELANHAVKVVEASVKAGRAGSDVLPMLLVRRADLEIQLHRPGDATRDAASALETLRAGVESGTFSSNLGHAHLALGRALDMQGSVEQSQSHLIAAAEHFEKALGEDHPETRDARRLLNRPTK